MGFAAQQEKREAPRIEVHKSVDVKTKYIYFAGSILNISPSGLFIKTNKPLPVGSEVEVILKGGQRKKPYVLQGVVRWGSEKPSGALPPGMGIRLSSPEPKLIKRIAKELKKTPKDF
jgi:uncharacterized protein (TIGR02266 family)